MLRESEPDSTLIWIPRLTACPPGEDYRVGRLALGPWSTVTTEQISHFTLTCLESDGRVRAGNIRCPIGTGPVAANNSQVAAALMPVALPT